MFQLWPLPWWVHWPPSLFVPALDHNDLCFFFKQPLFKRVAMPHAGCTAVCYFFPSQNHWHMSHVLVDRWCCVMSVTTSAPIFEAQGGSSFWRRLSVGVVGLFSAWSQQKTPCSWVLVWDESKVTVQYCHNVTLLLLLLLLSSLFYL